MTSDQKIVSSKVHSKNPKTEIRMLDYCERYGITNKAKFKKEGDSRLVSKICLN